MRDERDEIRSRIDLVDLVSQRVLLKRAGKYWKGLCPFHDDRNPSFYVSPDTGRYKCWSCGESGDAFTWVMKTQNVEFVEALQSLAEKAGVQLQKHHPGEASARQRQLDAMRVAQQFFQEQLSASKAATEYCERRGLDEEVRREWGLGYAPESDHMLAHRLRKDKFPLAEARELFLVEDDGSGGYFDKFRSRLMFPIHDERGDLVAFGGRIIGDGQPKYINSSDTPLFKKSRVLYGMHRAKESMAKLKTAVLVEGYLDVIACHRAGVTQAVASLGTSLAEDHARLLKRWCDEVVVLYDSDAAGEKAAARACEVLGAAGVRVKVALMPPGEDPDTLLRTAGAAAVVAATMGGLSPLDFTILQIEKKLDSSDPDFWTQIAEALGHSNSIPDVEKQLARLNARYLSHSRSAQESLIQQVRAVQRTKQKKAKTPAKESEVGPLRMVLPRAESMLFRAFMEGELRQIVYQGLQSGLIQSEAGMKLREAVLSAFPNEPPKGKAIEWLGEIEPDEIREALAETMLDVAEYSLVLKDRGPVTPGELADVLSQLQNEKDRMELQRLKSQEANEDAVQAAFKKMREKFERESHRWDR